MDVVSHTYLIPLCSGPTGAFPCAAFFALTGSTSKHFHRRRVSSAAADMTVVPSGDIDV